MGAPRHGDGFRLNELVAAISLATDLGTGQPMEHAARTCRLAVDLAAQLGLDAATTSDVYYVALLRFLGCTADAPEMAHLAGGDNLRLLAGMAPVYMGSTREKAGRLAREAGRGRPWPRRAGLLAEALAAGSAEVAHCEVGARLAARLGLGPGAVRALAHAYERWDGRGLPDGLSGEAVPVAVRVVVVARDAVLWQGLAGTEAAMAVLARRRGRAYDPAVVAAVRSVGLPARERPLDWEDLLCAEPDPARRIGHVDVDRALAAVGDFTDLRSTWSRGRSGRLADTAVAVGRACGLSDEEVVTVRRAALVADLGAVGVPSGVWQHAGPLGIADRERLRLHPYLTERVLGRCPGLESVAACAGGHHERLDGSGYHRGARVSELPWTSRLLAAVDVWTALCEDRPHRPAFGGAAARTTLAAEADAGRLDRTAVEAVVSTGAGGPRHAVPGPAGLSAREVEVLRLIARGRSNREVAAQLWISPKTVGHHVEHIYAKTGVTTRPAAALFAMENGLLGE